MTNESALKARLQRFATYFRFLDKPENFFLVVGGVFVILFSFINPPLQALDEPSHLFRIVELSKGHLFAKHIATQDGVERFGDFFPQSLINESNALVNGVNPETGKYNTHLISSYLFKNPKDQSLEIEGFEGSAVYTPVVYIPQVIAYKGSAIFTRSTLLRIYAARVANGLFWLALLYMAIRLIPIGKWTLVAFGLLPTDVFVASSLSADASAIAFCILFIAYVLHLRVTKQKMLTNKQLVILGVLMSLIALAKSAYYPVLLMIFLLPKRLFQRVRTSWLILLAVPLALSMIWSAAVSRIANVLRRSFSPGLITTTPANQVHYTLLHPYYIVYAFLNSVFSGVSDLTVRDLFGTFTWSRVLLPLWFQMFSLLLLVFILCYQLGRTKKFTLPKPLKAVPTLALVGSFCLIYVTFYFLWDTPDNPNIGDVQGRYFLPLLPLLIPIFTSKKTFINVREKTFVRVVQGGTFSLLLVTLIMLTTHFY